MDVPEEAASRAAAQLGVPWLGVHALTEFVFCPRAGLIEFEKQTADEGDEAQREPWANLGYVPLYDIHEIDEKLKRAARRFFIWLFAVLLLTPAAVVAYFRAGIWWLAIAFLTYLSLLKWLGCLGTVADLKWLRRLALTAPGREPDPCCMENQPVNWWELLRAGFEPTAPDGCASEQLRLAGRPWRILVRGSTQIPVFKKRHCTGPNGRALFPQHAVRIAAYCRLIQDAVGATSPYGVVLFDDCYDGVAINTSNQAATAVLEEALSAARAVIRSSSDSIIPQAPSPVQCSNCPLGRPRVHRPEETQTPASGVPLPVFAAMGADRRPYHSACGDRFHWLPPHQRAKEKGLQVVS